VWGGAGRRVGCVRPAERRRVGPAAAAPGRSRGTRSRSTGGAGSVKLEPLLQWSCWGSDGASPGTPSTPRGSTDCRRKIININRCRTTFSKILLYADDDAKLIIIFIQQLQKMDSLQITLIGGNVSKLNSKRTTLVQCFSMKGPSIQTLHK